jgi:diguanylate cyclase (GGDEF)-like protein
VDDDPVTMPAGWDDPLTGLEGPAFWQRVLIGEVARATKYERDLTVCVVEVEGIDTVIGAYGEAVARRVLRQAAELLRREARASDYCTRIDVCRFGVVLTETDEIAAINFVERVREAAPRTLPEVRGIVRLSFGWASPKKREAPDSVVRRAERRLIAELTH